MIRLYGAHSVALDRVGCRVSLRGDWDWQDSVTQLVIGFDENLVDMRGDRALL